MLIPATTTLGSLPSFLITSRTSPLLPLFFPVVTSTLSPLFILTFVIFVNFKIKVLQGLMKSLSYILCLSTHEQLDRKHVFLSFLQQRLEVHKHCLRI